MRRFFIFLLFSAVYLSINAQTTILKNGKEFFNGDDRHLRVYLNNNYDQLDPIEGVWIFTRIEYNAWGLEVSRTPNEITAAIVHDPGNMRRAYIEVNMSRAFCKEYQITYNIQTGGGSGYYPCEPQGCQVLAGQYYYDHRQKTLSRPAVSFSGNRAVLVGLRTFPQGPPTEILPFPGGTTPTNPDAQVTTRIARTISHPSGWEPYIDWGANIFPAYILSMNTMDPKTFPKSDDYLGDPLSVVGILINNPRGNSTVNIEIEPTPFSKGVSETFNLERKGRTYAIFPKVSWDYEKLQCNEQATPIDFIFKVTVNGKIVTQTATANLRALDDCPLGSYDYKGDPINLMFLAAAYVNQDHPLITDLMKEIREKKILRDFISIQGGLGPTIQQVYAFWKLLRDKGISYSTITNVSSKDKEVNSQRIRLLEDVIDETQANCIDGTALFASCLEKISIPSQLILVPGHAFLGYYVPLVSTGQNGEKKTFNQQFYLETTLLGAPNLTLSSLAQKYKVKPSEIQEVLENEPFKTMKSALYQQFNGGSMKPNPALDHFILASLSANLTYYTNETKNPAEIMAINVSEARTIGINAIHRCNMKNMLPATGDLSIRPRPNSKPEEVSPIPSNLKPDQNTQQPASLGSAVMPSDTFSIFHGTEQYDSLKFKTNAPKKQGAYFKVQIESTTNYQEQKSLYLELDPYGRRDLEIILPEMKKTRVLIGDFANYENAVPIAKKAQSLGFGNVAIVRYKDGNRYESKYRDWKLIP